MMTSSKEAYVWIWLPDQTKPIVAGKISAQDKIFVFNYGKSYLSNPDAISIFPHELPLKAGSIPPLTGLTLAGCIRDASPDAWGRRVIINKKFGNKRLNVDTTQLDELTYLLESGSNRIGALDFQVSPTDYVPRNSAQVSLENLLNAAELIQAGMPLPGHLNDALNHGTSIGGARPKALIEEDDRQLVAKFSLSTDLINVVKAEFIAMKLALLCGLNVANPTLAKVAGKDVLLIDRFDRKKSPQGWTRKCQISALTLLQLDEMMARYASYSDFAEIIRYQFTNPGETLKELLGRLVFNILCGNTDDHARNHAAFWDGNNFALTPAYDLCPQGRTGREASQAMLIDGENRLSKLSLCIQTAATFLLSEEDVIVMIKNQITTIIKNWGAVCDLAQISPIDKKFLMGRQFLNPFAFDDLEGKTEHLKKLAQTFYDL